MSLVYPASDPGGDAPQAHALLIGVGRYPHLIGGDKPLAINHFNMGQLSSPPASAQALANWLIEKRTTSHLNMRVPLGTVELLLSPTDYTDPSGRARTVDDATFANISAAFQAWLARCNRNPDNIGIFYFCGHGLERADAYLLASDHGDSVFQPWRNTIHFTATEQGVRAAARARTFCWLIDACRNNPIDTVRWPLIPAQPLFTPPIQQFPPRVTEVLRATTSNGVAHGPPGGGVSYFTAALIRCLDSLGASSPLVGTRWRVTTESLRCAMEELMRRTPLPDGGFGRCDAGGSSNTFGQPTTLHTLPGAAGVLTTITYDPELALEFASLSVGRNGDTLLSRNPAPECWELELEAAKYDIRAHFPHREYPDAELHEQTVAPPVIECALGGP
jgi:Caspase domain